MHSVVFSRIKGFHRLGLIALAGALYAVPGLAQVGTTVFFQGESVSITRQDAEAELVQMPQDVRANFFATPEKMRELVELLFIRRALASQAQRDGIAQQPEIQRQIAVMQERILAEAQLEQVENASLPSAELIDKQIRTIYKAEPERFTTPAETHARHILIAGQDDAARAKAEKLLAELRAGADFAALAREHSADPGSAAKGGDLGFFPKGKMVPAFEQAAFALKKPGDLSPVVPTQFGFHIIRLEGRKAATVKPFDEVKDQLRAETIAKLKNDARKKEVERVRALGQGDATALEAFIAEQKALAEKTAGTADQPPSAGKP